MGGDVVGEVANDGKRLGEEGGGVEGQEIALDDVEAGVMAVEIVYGLAVNLDGVEVESLFAIEVFGEDTHAGAYLQHVGREAGEGVGNAAGDGLVGEEMLPEGFLGPDRAIGGRAAHGGM